MADNELFGNSEQLCSETHDKHTKTHVCDLISRQEAINALGERPMVYVGSDYELGARNQYDADILALETAPPAQPVNIAKLQPNCNQVASDCIGRQAAIDALAEWHDAAITNRLNNLPSAQQWIPCKTSLPEKENTRVIIQTNAGAVIIDGVYGGIDVYGHHVWRDGTGGLYWDDEIVAWMPGFIPEPYKEHSDAD